MQLKIIGLKSKNYAIFLNIRHLYNNPNFSPTKNKEYTLELIKGFYITFQYLFSFVLHHVSVTLGKEIFA